ncbi:MAG: hypothetical protein JCHSAcid_03440 [uncultured Acidilobus sp. JCHS]|nr:MAG: hypothetical protein JCHSAcid_03440 [uncultured Acidilobus sp. JCHS]
MKGLPVTWKRLWQFKRPFDEPAWPEGRYDLPGWHALSALAIWDAASIKSLSVCSASVIGT